jgi:hypothetical protein
MSKESRTIEIGLALVLLMGCNGAAVTPYPRTFDESLQSLSAKPIEVSALDFLKDYSTNEGVGNAKYLNNWVQVTGEVERISDRTVRLADQQWDGAFRELWCEFEPSEQDSIAELSPRVIVTIIGFASGRRGDKYIQIERCKLIR